MHRFVRWVVFGSVVMMSHLTEGGQATRLDELITDLRDDDERWNAAAALRALMSLDIPPTRALQEALDSDDRQQRQLACDLLWRMYDPRGARNRWYRSERTDWAYYRQGAITERMIEVTIEGLADDDTPYAPRDEGNLMLMNAANGFFRLSAHAVQAREHLLAGLESHDVQQRFLCALALARGGVASAAEDVLPILLPHLRDNDIPEDAKWCVHAIFQLGDAALPTLRRTRDTTDDDQQRDLVTLLILNIEGPPADQAEADARRRLNEIAQSVHDPSLDAPLDDSMWWLRRLARD